MDVRHARIDWKALNARDARRAAAQADVQPCSLCGRPNSPHGFREPGVAGLRTATRVWRCQEHTPERGHPLPAGLGTVLVARVAGRSAA